MDAKQCCDHKCNEGRDCPDRSPYDFGPLFGLVAFFVSTWIVIGAVVEAFQ